ncbi:MAG: L,D-transpeptidase [Deltaproteobacteria bacterium]|nr:L,D-transpeptidase [Deltaproteobacteria bacterium]
MPLLLLAAPLFFISTAVNSDTSSADTTITLKSNAKNGCAVLHPSDSSMEWDCVRLKKNESLESLFKENWRDVARFNRIDRRHGRPYANIKVPGRLTEIKDFSPMPTTYPKAEKLPKFILIDLSEQFLGAYEHGRLVFSSPVATGERGNETPAGEFRVSAFSRNHRSSKYTIEKTDIPYPMNYALRFHINSKGVSFWIHGRDMPGYPASHGCIGLYDERMQQRYYKDPKDPVLDDAKRLYDWAIGDSFDDGKLHDLKDGPVMLVTGEIPGTPGELAMENPPF